MPRLHFCFVGSRPAMTVLAWIAVLPFDLRCAPPVLPITIGRPGSSPPRSLPKQDFNAIPQQTASAEIPIASSDAHPRHTSRGFLPCRFADAGPRVRRATVVGPPSANLHITRPRFCFGCTGQMLDQSACMRWQRLLAAYANDQLPHRPCIRESKHAERHGSPTARSGSFRHDGNPHTRLHHATNGIQSS